MPDWVPAEQRALVMLNSLMMPFSQTARAELADDLSSVLPRLNPLRPVVAVWHEGKLAGVIPPKALQRRLGAAQAVVSGN